MIQTARNQISAVSSIEKTGLELVRKRKSRGRLATTRDYARIDFQPWTREPDMRPGELIPADKVLLDCGIPARLAYATMLRTKAQLVKMFDEVEIEHIDSMLASYCETAERLKAIVSMLDTAYLRILVAGSAHVIEKGKAQGIAKRRRTLAKHRR